MELKMPSPEQAYWGLRAMKTIALADGMLDNSERHMMETAQRIFGTTYSSEALDPITPHRTGSCTSRPENQTSIAEWADCDVAH
jgi:hypothetical protein